MRIGIFGGTFDPPHIGHLILGAEAFDQLDLDRLAWVLTQDPPHKLARSKSKIEIRLEMLKLAISDNPAFEISRVDIDRPGPHFSIDTVRLIAEQYPDAEYYFLIGGDSLHDLPLWHKPFDLLRSITSLGVMRRPGDEVNIEELEKKIPGIGEKIIYIDAPLLEIASNEIRERIISGRHFRYFLPGRVFKYIQEKNIYRNQVSV